MLAFLQEQEPEGVESRPSKMGEDEREAGGVERDTKSDSRDTQAQEQEYLTVAAHGKNVRKTTCLFSDVRQVEVDELKKNPFKAEMFLGDLKEAGGLDVDDEIEAEQQLRQQAKNMQLLSIMATDAGNCCMIDDKILYEGDSIGGFKVRQISDSFVKLEWAPKRPEMHLAGQSECVEIVLKLLE